MNDDDRDLREVFRRLRDAERAGILGFRIQPPPQRRMPRPQLGALLVILIVIIAGTFVEENVPDRRPAPPPVTLSTWRAPTDVLLQTPGRELVQSTPNLRFNGGRS